jgi:hypothetical protein
MHVIHATVDDPTNYGRERGMRQRVAINRDTDVLETEYCCRRISDSGYRTGRTYQRVMRRNTSPSGSGQWLPGDKVDASRAKEAAIAAHFDAARAKVELAREVCMHIGVQGELLLKVVLVDGHPFCKAAEMIYRMSGKRAASHCAWQFRKHCEYLAEKLPWMTQESFA